MKKEIFSKLALAFLAVAATCSFTACSNDDGPEAEDNFTTEYTFVAEFTPDLLKTAVVTAYILSPEGTVTEETITGNRNSWTLKGNSIPDKAGVMFEFDARSGNFSGDYETGYSMMTTVTCLNNEKVVDHKAENYEEICTVSAENLADFYGTSLVLGGQINDKGAASITDGTNLDFGLNGTTNRPPFGSGGSL